MSEVFLDANILVYAFSDDPRSEEAIKLLEQRPASGIQALNEMIWSLRRKHKRNWAELNAASQFVEAALCDVHTVEPKDHRDAFALVQAYKFAWWDAVLIATALRTGATTFVSEDHQHGFVVAEAMTIINPFRQA